MSKSLLWFEVKHKEEGFTLKCPYCGGLFESLFLLAHSAERAQKEAADTAQCDDCSGLSWMYWPWDRPAISVITMVPDVGTVTE